MRENWSDLFSKTFLLRAKRDHMFARSMSGWYYEVNVRAFS
jgi:hypothetical protein